MKKIASFEAACKLSGDDPNKLPDTTGMSDIRAKCVIAEHKLNIIYRETNGGKVIDLSGPGKLKWTPWLRWVPSLGAFVCTLTYCTYTCTTLGARFWFEDENTSDYFGKQHIDLINDLMRPGY